MNVIRSMSAEDRGFAWIHALKKQTGKRIPELLAIGRNNDPFFIGSPAQVKQAKWFAAMWRKQYHDQVGIHLRRVHYRLDAIGYPKLSHMPYRNIRRDWTSLCECSRCARLLGLVPVDAFDDHRNSDPYALHWNSADLGVPSVLDAQTHLLWSLPELRLNFSAVDWALDTPDVDGYDADDHLDRAYYIEMWIEKSTMDDVLVPLTNELGVRLVPSSGFQSISNIVKLLQRVRAMHKPTRIFYVSDFDKAGRAMPVAVARQIEFWLKQQAPRADIKLRPLALTSAQIAQYKLPWSDQNTVELDALEAIVPGELERIVREACAPYLDRTIPSQLADAKAQAERIVVDEWSSLTTGDARRLETLRRQVQATAKKHQRHAALLNKHLQRDLAKFKKPLAQLQATVAEHVALFAPALPTRPTQSAIPETADWLYDASRPYFDQLAVYKVHARTPSLPPRRKRGT